MFTRHSVTLAATAIVACAAPAFAFQAGPGVSSLQLRSAPDAACRLSSVAVGGSLRRVPRSVDLQMSGKLAQKYGHLRGVEVEPCDKSVQRFYEYYGKPVPFVFRSATNEILYLSHLDLVNARFEYNPIWACGVYSTFDVFFQGLDSNTRQELYTALMRALKLDPEKVKADAESVLAWAQGKTEADVVNAINGGDSSAVGTVLGSAKKADEDDFLYTRNFGAGLIKIMQLVGVEPNSANAKKWADAMSFTQVGGSFDRIECLVVAYLVVRDLSPSFFLA